MNNFLFVDRILELEPGKRALGIKHVTPFDLFLDPGRAGKPVTLMTCIVGEAIGQAGAWAVMSATDFKMRPVAGVLNQINVYGEAYVGDTILLETTIDSLSEDRMAYHGVASIDGKPIVELYDGLGPLLPMEDFIHPDVVKQQFALINRPGEKPTTTKKERNLCESFVVPALKMMFDHILSWEKGREIVVQKTLSLNDPYFADHFPRKPVFPLSLLLSCKLQLASLFLSDMFGADKAEKFRLTQVRKIKMNQFVQPGESMVVTMRLKEMHDDRVVFRFRCEVNGKRVCLSEAEFIKG